MYEEHWGFSMKPFENTPDPRFFYTSGQHEEALTRLIYGVREGKGALMLTGVFGCGKTLLAQVLLSELDQDTYRVAMVTNPMMSSLELLRFIATKLGATDLPTRKTEILKDVVLGKLEELLMANFQDGKQTVILIDEMHVVEDRAVFEDLRMLLNFQLQDRFLSTLILMGQPELKKQVEQIKQLEQRIAIRYHVAQFKQKEMENYIRHRLAVAGQEKEIFDETSFPVIFQKSGGIPRRINQICDMALFIGFSKKSEVIGEPLIVEAGKGLEG